MNRAVPLLLALGLTGLSISVFARRLEAPRAEPRLLGKTLAPDHGSAETRADELVAGSTVPLGRVESAPEAHASALPLADTTITVCEIASGAPVPGASIEIEFDPAWGEPSWRRVEHADRTGRLVLELLPGRLSAVAWTESGSSHERMLTIDGQQPGALLLELVPGVAVCGVVRDRETARPLAGIRLGASTLGSRQVVSGPDGRFCYSPLPASGISTFLELSGGAYPAHSLLIAVDPDTKWSIVAGGRGLVSGQREGAGTPIELELVLDAGRTVTGRVVDARGPRAGVAVSVRGYLEAAPGIRLPDEGRGVTAADGGFSVAGLRRDIWYRIDLASEELVCAPVLIEPGEERVVDCGALLLEDGYAVFGSLVDPLGRPIEGLQVSFCARSENGERVAGGSRPASDPTSTVGAKVRPGVGLRPTPRIDSPTQGPDVLRLLSERAARRARSDSGGRFAFPPVPAGSYRFECFDLAGSPLLSREVRIPEEAATLLDVELDGMSCVAGRVRGMSGPVAGARVLVLQGAASVVVTADTDGRFAVGGLQPGAPYKAYGFVEEARGPAAVSELLERTVGGDDVDLWIASAQR